MKEVKRTQRIIGINHYYIEAGELAQEIGKYYMQDLNKAIESHRSFEKENLYFLCKTEKDPLAVQNVHLKMGITDRKLTRLVESTDFWQYNYKKEELTLLWTIPRIFMFKNYLRTPGLYAPFLIECIKKYIKQEKINLKNLSSQVLSS